MTINLITESRIFADHYQFYVRDSKVDILECNGGEDIEMVGAYIDEVPKGIHQFIMVTTCADLNDHWLSIYRSDAPPNLEKYEFSASVLFRVESGEIAIDGVIPEPMLTADIPPGLYKMYICAKNLGVDPKPDQYELSDNEFKTTQVESYDIYFVSKSKSSSNVVKLFS